jgi:hypothetical protein
MKISAAATLYCKSYSVWSTQIMHQASLTLRSFTVTTMWFAITPYLKNQIKCSYEAKGH